MKSFFLFFLLLTFNVSRGQGPSIVSDYNVVLEDFHDADFFPLENGQVIASNLFRLNGKNLPFTVGLDALGELSENYETAFASTFSNFRSYVSRSDGKIFITSLFAPTLQLFNEDGSLDPTFNLDPSLNPSFGLGIMINDLLPLENDQVLIAGNILFPIPTSQALFRLNSNGDVDGSFSSPITGTVRNIIPDGDDHLFLVGSISQFSQFGPFIPLARIDLNGALDPNFNTTSISSDSLISAHRTTSGQIIIADRNGINRLNADGSVDPTFTPIQPNESIFNFNQSSDGCFYFDGGFTEIDGSPSNGIAKLTATGELDPNFAPPPANRISPMIDGSLLIWGEFISYLGEPRSGVARIDASGNLLDGFTQRYAGRGNVRNFSENPDGSIMVQGNFVSVSSGLENSAASGLTKLNPNGFPDPSFQTFFPNGRIIESLTLSNQQILVRVWDNILNSSEWFRLQADGSVDPTFPQTIKDVLLSKSTVLGELSDQSVIFFRESPDLVGNFFQLIRIRADDSIDLSGPTLNEAPSNDFRILEDGFIYAIENQILNRFHPDGQRDFEFSRLGGRTLNDFAVLPGFNFLSVGESFRTAIITDSSGLQDDSFQSGIGADRSATIVRAYPELGQIIIGGTFNSYQGVDRQTLIQINFDGSLEESFDIGEELFVPPNDIQQLENGDLLIGGALQRIRPTPKTVIATIPVAPSGVSGAALSATTIALSWSSDPDSEGTLIQRRASPDSPWLTLRNLAPSQSTFTDVVSPGSNFTYRLTAFTQIGESSTEIQLASPAEFGLAGQLSPLQIDLVDLGEVEATLPLANGQYLIAGIFDWVNGQALGDLSDRRRIVRVNADGTLDTSFDHGTVEFPSIQSLTEQADGKILIGTSSSQEPHLFRILSDGSLDPSFQILDLSGNVSPYGGTGSVRSSISQIAILNDNRILISGDFDILQSEDPDFEPIKNVAILSPDGSPLSNPSPDIISKVVAMTRLNNGQLLLVAGEEFHFLNADGSLASTINLDGRFGGVGDIYSAYQIPTGQILLGGKFSGRLTVGDLGSTNTFPLGNLVIMNLDGSLNETLTSNLGAGANEAVTSIAGFGSGNALIAGDFTEVDGQEHSQLAIVNGDGSISSQTVSLSPDASDLTLRSDNEGRVIVGGTFSELAGETRFSIGLLQEAPNLSVTDFIATPISRLSSPEGLDIVSAPDGTLLLAGCFAGAASGNDFFFSPSLFRILPSGAVDPNFNPPSIDGEVFSIVVDDSGTITLAGSFTAGPAGEIEDLLQLSPSGEINIDFLASPKPSGPLRELELDNSGQLYIRSVQNIFRLTSDGVIDPTFTIQNSVVSMELHQERLFLSTGFNNQERTTLVYNLDGSLDETLTSALSLNPNAFRSFDDEGLLVGGSFREPNTTEAPAITSLLLGSPPTFQWPTLANFPTSVSGFSTGSAPALAFGDFFFSGERKSLATYSPTEGYLPDFLAESPDGEIIAASRWGDQYAITGNFDHWGDNERSSLAFISATPSSITILPVEIDSVSRAPNSSRLIWTSNSGTSSVRIEARPLGGAEWQTIGYSPTSAESFLIGHEDRIATWEYRLLTFGPNGQTSEFSTPISDTFMSFEAWRSTEGIDPALSANSDTDNDGLPLLMEYAFETNPNEFNLAPNLSFTGQSIGINGPRNRPDISYETEISSDLQVWNTLFGEAAGLAIPSTFPSAVDVDERAIFLRHRVTLR